MSPEQQPALVRTIGRWTLTALVLNSIIGGGIFGLPSIVAGLVGSASVCTYLIAAAGIGVIMACFAEVASQFRKSGGPYLYAHVAFGRFAGIEMGWLAWLVRLTAAAANANLFIIYLAEFWPQARHPTARALLLTLLIGVLAVVNYLGVGAGARLSNAFAVAKLLPLVLFVGVGLFFLRNPQPNPTILPGPSAWLEAMLVLIFAYGGFEAALMPTGETEDPRHDAPFALFTALAVCATVYTLIQVVVMGVLPSPAGTDRPLALAARSFLGAGGAVLMTLGALLSVYGYLSGQMLNTPRLTYAFAEQEDFPNFFGAIHSRFRTPYVSIAIFAVLVWALAVAGTFRWNVTLSAVARLFTYGLVCAALPVLRRKQPQAPAFRLPAGFVFGLLGVAFSLVLVSRMGRNELLILLATSVIASLNWAWVRWRGRSAPSAP